MPESHIKIISYSTLRTNTVLQNFITSIFTVSWISFVFNNDKVHERISHVHILEN